MTPYWEITLVLISPTHTANHAYLSFAEAVDKQWLDSPGHRRNLLSKDARQLGCGAYFYRDPDFHDMPNFKAVQNFQLFREIVPGKATDR